MESGGDIMPENVRDLATCCYDRDTEVEKHRVIVEGSGDNFVIDVAAAATTWLGERW
jgi:hypothetical protein